MKSKHIVLIVIGGILLVGFAAFVLIFALILTVGEEAEREEAGKLTIAVRHKMIYKNEITPTVQCVQPQVGVCETPPKWNRATHRAGVNYCQPKFHDPQPFLRQPEISDWEEFEFEIEREKTYYWYVFFENHEDCTGFLPAELERFETGEIKFGKRETKRIEKDFTK